MRLIEKVRGHLETIEQDVLKVVTSAYTVCEDLKEIVDMIPGPERVQLETDVEALQAALKKLEGDIRG